MIDDATARNPSPKCVNAQERAAIIDNADCVFVVTVHQHVLPSPTARPTADVPRQSDLLRSFVR